MDKGVEGKVYILHVEVKEELKSRLTLVLVVRHQELRGEMLDCGSNDMCGGPELVKCAVMLKRELRGLWEAISLTEASAGQALVNIKEEKE